MILSTDALFNEVLNRSEMILRRNETPGYGIVDWPKLSAYVAYFGPFLHIDRVRGIADNTGVAD